MFRIIYINTLQKHYNSMIFLSRYNPIPVLSKWKNREEKNDHFFSRTHHTLVFPVAKRNLSVFSHVYSSLYGYAAGIIARSVIFRNGGTAGNRYLARINWNGGMPRPATTRKNFNFVSASGELFSPLCTYICLGGARVCEPCSSAGAMIARTNCKLRSGFNLIRHPREVRWPRYTRRFERSI